MRVTPGSNSTACTRTCRAPFSPCLARPGPARARAHEHSDPTRYTRHAKKKKKKGSSRRKKTQKHKKGIHKQTNQRKTIATTNTNTTTTTTTTTKMRDKTHADPHPSRVYPRGRGGGGGGGCARCGSTGCRRGRNRSSSGDSGRDGDILTGGGTARHRSGCRRAWGSARNIVQGECRRRQGCGDVRDSRR